ncbi:MAG: hypothetical protein ACKOXZ_14355, partial [Polynucleobacter victoriensis]
MRLIKNTDIDWLVMQRNKTSTKIIKTALAVFYTFAFIQLSLAANLDYKLDAKQVAKDTYVFEGANDDFSKANGCNIINTGFIV